MFGFLIAVAAGAATPMIEGPVARPIARALGQNIEVQDTEIRLIAFAVALFAAAILGSVFDSGSAVGLIVGGTLGYFGLRLVRWVQRVIEGRRD
ncbi:hypothetical protein [Pseudooctadecabacter jejudonensis]|uniref:Uncharacterized protein n=1 Tax=Pseudooctadecabacter jejudonensis TaxID=1391910 RepID=A0A1Y5TCJ9_9RHOB|nr:hypothetical protein [Pseudooctadecabacter jejudonensis]SLN58846.1 hypothetical protein PSJ8397_03115 [Pseudooctadecabacter jejudonensis]